MMSPLRILLLLTVLCTVKSTFAWAQTETLRSTVSAAAGNRKMIVINGQATSLAWAEGITRIADLDAYAKTGFNTVVVRLFWSMGRDGSLVPQDLAPQRTFANAAAARGLFVIYALPEAPVGMIDQFTFSAANQAYFMMWENWTRGAMAALQTTPRLVGWMLPDDPRGLPYTSDEEFGLWLRRRYPSIHALNREWMTRFETYESISIAALEKVIDIWRGVETPQGAMTDAQFREYVNRSAAGRGGDPNWAFHPAALALGIYRWDTYRALVDRWATIVRQADPGHIVLSGQLTDYAQLLALPPSVDVSLPAIWPGSAENDLATGNPQAVDIARRGGRFCALPVFPTALPDGFEPEVLRSRLNAWADAALVHGASGMAMASWPALQQDTELQQTVQTALTRWQERIAQPQWQQVPTATTAMLLTPLADGFTQVNEFTESAPPPRLGQWQMPQAPRTRREERGLYGFCNHLIAGEPSDLVYALRWGTRFGSVDYLSPDDLGGRYSLEQGGTLKKYTALLMPQALWMPPPLLTELTQYAASGGVIVADLGIGAAQQGGMVHQFSRELSALLGVIPQRQLTVSFNLHPGVDAAMLPSWGAMATAANSVLTAGDAPGGAAFAGPTLFTQLLPGTRQLALGFQQPLPLGNDPDNKRFLLQRAWLSAAPHGQGLVIFAPFRLWTHWRPGFRGFDAFHQDILGRGAAVSTILGGSLVPLPSAPAAAQMFPEIINYPQGIALANHTPPGPEGAGSQLAAITTGNVGNFLWSGAVNIFGSAPGALLPALRPAPSGTPADFAATPGQVQLFSWTAIDKTTLLEQLPLHLQFTQNTASAVANVIDNDKALLRLALWPGADTALPQDGQFNIPLQSGTVHLVINDQAATSGYQIAPHSTHHLVITDWSKTNKPDGAPYQQEAEIRANAQGQLTLELSGSALQVQLTPVRSSLSVPMQPSKPSLQNRAP